MRKLALVLLVAVRLHAQVDVLRDVVVLKIAGMDKVEVRRDIKYDGARTLDLYLPPNAKGPLPAVIFLNGVGIPELKNWGQYTSWPRLVAARGMAAIAYQTEGDGAQTQTEALLKYIREHAKELNIDASRVALWSCSANVRVGTAIAAAQPPRAAVYYYGIMTTPPQHAATPVLVARAGLDVLRINETIDAWVQQAVALEAAVTFINYPQGRHGFELIDDTAESRAIVEQTLDFLQFHLTHAPTPMREPVSPAQLQKLLRDQGAAAFIARVRELRSTHPNAVAVQEQTLNTLGYLLIEERRLADSVAVFELITSIYPDSANAYDSLGDAYEAAGRNADAVAASKRVLELVEKMPAGPRRDAIRASAAGKLQRLQP